MLLDLVDKLLNSHKIKSMISIPNAETDKSGNAYNRDGYPCNSRDLF